MKAIGSRPAFLLAASLLSGASTLHAQAWDGALTGNQDWLLATNWVGDTIPDGIDAVATFGTAFSGNPSGPYWSGQSVTVGTINFNQTSGNVSFGFNGTTRATLVLATSSGTPTLSVAAGGQAYAYALLEGTQGFTKTGAGTLTFRYNSSTHTYSGTVTLNAGVLGIDRDGSLGNADNDIVFSGNASLQAAPGSGSGTIALGSGRTLTINSGVTATLGSINATTNLTVNGVIAGAGNLLINGANGLFTLNGANTYTGTTTLRNGGKITLGAGSNLSSGDLILDVTAAGTGNTLNLGGNSQTVARLRTTASVAPTAASTGTVTAGSLTLNGDIDHIVGQMHDGSVLDLSGLTAFTVDRANRSYNFQTGTYLGTTNTNTLRLAAGTNTFTVSNLTFGTANASVGTANTALVRLGETNRFNVAGTFQVGGYNGAGEVAFAAGLTAPSLRLRAADGSSALPTLVIGDTSSGVRSGHGVLDLSAGSLDAVVGAVVIGRQIAGSNTSPSASSLSMGGGSLEADTLRLSVKTSTGTSTLTSTFTQGGGVARVGAVTLGDSSDPTATSLTRLLPTLNLDGGEFLATSITTAGTVFAANSARTVNLNGGTLGTYRSADGATTTDLTVAAAGTAAGERISLVLGVLGGGLQAEAGRTLTLGSNTQLSGSGLLTKSGEGVLLLTQAGLHTGGTRINDGTLRVGHLSALGTGLVTIADGGTLDLNGFAAANAVSILSGGTLDIGALDYEGNLTLASGAAITGTGSVTFVGSTNLTGVTLAPGIELSVEGGGDIDFGDIAYSADITYTGGAVAGANFTGNLVVSGLGRILGPGLTAGTVKLTAGNGATIEAGFSRPIVYEGGELSGLDSPGMTALITVGAGASLDVDLYGEITSTAASYSVLAGSALRGSATFNGAVTVAGTLAPGNSPGLMEFTDGLTLAATSVTEWEFDASIDVFDPDPGVNTDLLVVSGGQFLLEAGATLRILAPEGQDYSGDAWDILREFEVVSINGTATYNPTNSFALDTSAAGLFADFGAWSVFQDSTKVSLIWTPAAIPEPSTYGLVLGGLALAGAALRRRRRVDSPAAPQA